MTLKELFDKLKAKYGIIIEEFHTNEYDIYYYCINENPSADDKVFEVFTSHNYGFIEINQLKTRKEYFKDKKFIKFMRNNYELEINNEDYDIPYKYVSDYGIYANKKPIYEGTIYIETPFNLKIN